MPTQESLPQKITVVVADGHPLTRTGIRSSINETCDIEIVGEAGCGPEIQEIVDQLHPNVLLLEIKMLNLEPFDLVRWVRHNYPAITPLVLTAHDRDSYLASMIAAGASGFITKNESPQNILAAIRSAASGRNLYSQDQLKRAKHWQEIAGRKWDSLSRRERQILTLMAQGLSNKAIASKLDVKLKTVAFHASNTNKKLGAASRQEAIVWMLKYIPEQPKSLPA